MLLLVTLIIIVLVYYAGCGIGRTSERNEWINTSLSTTKLHRVDKKWFRVEEVYLEPTE